MKPYAKFGILTVLIVGSLVWLAMGGIKQTKTYYETIPELHKMGKAAEGKRVRVSGYVQTGTIVKDGAQVSFVIHENGQQLKVLYTGTDPLPDTFKGEAQALADGRLGPDGVFEASKIQAKCASKYEVKPPQQLSHPAATPTKVTQKSQPLQPRLAS
jgi:cytochrome c-type biogenesis protein CcmE